MITDRRYWQAVALVTGQPLWIINNGFSACAGAVRIALQDGPETIPILADRLGYAEPTIRSALMSMQRLGFVDRVNNVWSLSERVRPHYAPLPVTFDGTTYASYADAARALGMSRQAIRHRIQQRSLTENRKQD